MPQNTPMKRQFTTIDGRTVMSNLPQHWGGNDWTITGVDNPLPVGNYVQTESGVWIPQKGSDDGAADVRLTESNVEKRLERIYLHDSVSLADGSRVVGEYTDVSKYKELFMFAYSSLDVDVRMVIRGPRFETIWHEDGWKTINEAEVIIPPQQVALSTHPIVKKQLEGRDEIRVDITPVDVPTSGSISIWVVGVPN